MAFCLSVFIYINYRYNPRLLSKYAQDAIKPANIPQEWSLQRGQMIYLVGLTEGLHTVSRTSNVVNPESSLVVDSAIIPRLVVEIIEDTDGIIVKIHYPQAEIGLFAPFST